MNTKSITAQVTDIAPDHLTAYASVEVVDEDGDIIRIDGMDLSYNTEKSPIKIFPEHTYSAEGSLKPAVIGKVESLEKTFFDNTNVPALKFVMSWAKNEDGQITELAKAWKELYDTKYLDSFSVGVSRDDGLKTDSGVDWTKTTLREISAAAIPANKFANVIKTLKKHNIQVKEKDMEQTPAILNPTGVEGEGFTYKKDMSDMMTSLSKHTKDLCDHFDKCFGDHKASVEKAFSDLNERLDDVESAVTVAQDGPDTSDDGSLSQKALKEIELKKTLGLKKQEDALASVASLLADLRKSLKA